MRNRLALAALLVVFAHAPNVALTEVLTEGDIAHALNIANGSEGTRALFHSAYLVAVDHDTIEDLDVVSEFRRFVLAAEDQLKAGNWMMGRGGFDPKGRTLKDVLRPLEGQLSIRVRLRFHPHNSYIALPAFDILLGEPTLLAINATRIPHITPADGEPGTRDVIHGATIEVFYNSPTINDRVLPIRIVSEGEELTRVNFDFSRIQ